MSFMSTQKQWYPVRDNGWAIQLLLTCLIMTGLCLSGLLTEAQASSFERLFTTPKQRQLINEQRATQPQVNNQPELKRWQTVTIRFDGLLTDAKGQHVVWVNGQPLDQQTRLRRRHNIKLRVPYLFVDSFNSQGHQYTQKLAAGDKVTIRYPATIRQNSAQVQSAKQTNSQLLEPDNQLTVTTQTSDSSERRPPITTFDEADLALQDYRIQLLEARLKNLQNQNAVQNGLTEEVFTRPKMQAETDLQPANPVTNNDASQQRYFQKPGWTRDANRNNQPVQ